MKFEVKKIDAIGCTREIDADNSMQMLSISVGIVGCSYDDIVSNKIVEYTFTNTMSIQAVKDGIASFSETWVATNYPEVA